MCKISFLLPNVVAFSCYTVNIHLEKWLMRCDTKRTIWWDLYNKHIYILHQTHEYHLSHAAGWQIIVENQTLFSFCETNAAKFGTKNEISHKIIMQWKNHTILLLMLVAEKVLLLLVISLTAEVAIKQGYYVAWYIHSYWWNLLISRCSEIHPTKHFKPFSDFLKCKWIFSHIQYIPRNMHTVFALLCFVVVIYWLIFPYPPCLLRWHCGNLTIAPVPAKQPWWIWINTSCEIIMNDYITTTKRSTTKSCAYFLGYTVYNCIFWGETGLIQLVFSQHCGCWWCIITPTHQWPQS